MKLKQLSTAYAQGQRQEFSLGGLCWTGNFILFYFLFLSGRTCEDLKIKYK
jgi:hypothetical protein